MAFQGPIQGGTPPGSPPEHLVGGYPHDMELFDGVPGAPSRSSRSNDLPPADLYGVVGQLFVDFEGDDPLGVAPLSFGSAPGTPNNQVVPFSFESEPHTPEDQIIGFPHVNPFLPAQFGSPLSNGSTYSPVSTPRRVDALFANALFPSPIRNDLGPYGALGIALQNDFPASPSSPSNNWSRFEAWAMEM